MPHNSEIEVNSLVYIAKIDADSGKILSLKKSFDYEDKMLDQMTIAQLNQLFPDLQRTANESLELIENTSQGVFKSQNTM